MTLNCESPNEFDNLLLSAVRLGDTAFLKTHLLTITDSHIYLNRLYNGPNGQKYTLLMIACLEGYEDMVSMLLNSFKPDCEILNDIQIKFKEQKLFENVTVLWVAAAINNFEIVKQLVEYGARVNHTTKTNSTALRCACFHGSLSMVRYLVEHGADIHIMKEHFNTNLVLSVSCKHLQLVIYLIDELGCDVNERCGDGRSPLASAVKRESLEMVKFLLSRGARNVRLTDAQMSPLMFAAEKKLINLVEVILPYCSLLEQIEAEELLGSAFVCAERDTNDFLKAFEHFSRALELRTIHNLPKPLRESTGEIFNYRQECQTLEQLKEFRSNSEEMYIEALLIRERLLGPTNIQYRHSIRYCGAALIHSEKYYRAVTFWMYELDLRRQYSIPLNTKKLRSFARVFAKIIAKSCSLPIQSLCRVLTVIVDDLAHNSVEFDYNLHTLLFLITIGSQYVAKTVVSDTDRANFYRVIYTINQRRYVTCDNGSSLLHLCLNNDTLGSDSAIDQICKYPCLYTTRTLLQCRADVNATDARKNTPLHVFLSNSHGYNESILQILCDANAHLDYVNDLGNTPLDMTSDSNIKQLVKGMMKISLKCLCARLIQKANIPFHDEVSNALVRFVEKH